MKLSATVKWIGLALLGLAISAAVAIAASDLVSRQIGIASESVSAGDTLAPAVESAARQEGAGGTRPGPAPGGAPGTATESDTGDEGGDREGESGDAFEDQLDEREDARDDREDALEDALDDREDAAEDNSGSGSDD